MPISLVTEWTATAGIFPRLGELKVFALLSFRLVLRFVPAPCAQGSSHRTARRSAEVERSRLDGLDLAMSSLDDVDELFQVTRVTVQPVRVPGDHGLNRAGSDVIEQPAICRAGAAVVSAQIVVLVDVADLPTPAANDFPAVLLLAL